MPWSPSQHRLFEAAAHDTGLARRKGIKVTDARRMAHEGVKRAKGGLALAAEDEDEEYTPPKRGAPRGRVMGATRYQRLAPGGQAQDPSAPSTPSYQIGQGGPAGVQLLQWGQLDPYVQTGSPIAMAEGGQPPPSGIAGMLDYLKTMGSRQQRPGGGNPAPSPRSGTIGMPNAEVDQGLNTATDPKMAALDPRSRAIAQINERLQQQSSLSGAQNATMNIMGRGLQRPGLERLAFSNYVRPGLADGGRLIDLLKKLPRRERWDYLKENRLRDITGENAMFRGLGSPASPVQMHGGIPDFKVKNPAFMPRSRQRFMLYDSSVPKPGTNNALELGSIATNVGDIKGQENAWMPKDLIDIDLHKPARGEGYGKETLAMLLSSMPHEGEKFPLYDVKRSAKSYWDSLGAQMKNPSRPFRQRDKAVFDREGMRDLDRSVYRNNDYYLTPGDFLDTVDRFADGGKVKRPPVTIDQKSAPRAPEPMRSSIDAPKPTIYSYDADDLPTFLDPRREDQRPMRPPMKIRGYDEGGDVGGREIAGGLGLGAAALLPFLRKRHINRMARPFSRALSKPVLGMEAVSDKPLSRQMSDLRYDFARQMVPHRYADLPVHKGQGAWMSGEGDDAFMQHNPLYMQELPRRMGSLRDDTDAMYYAGQMGENLEQAATPVNRFVPHLMNTPEDANAMMIPGVDNRRLREIAERAGPDWVTAHRPGNRAMMFPTGDEPLEPMARKLGVSPRYGRSDQDVDRVLLSRKPLGYESGLYSEVGAQPRNASYAARESQALAPSADRLLESFKRLRATELSGAK